MSHITPDLGSHVLPKGGEYIPAEPGWRKPNPHYELTSDIRRGAIVSFPEFTGERVYMQPFIKACGEVLLPSNLARWVRTVTNMLFGIETKALMYLMIDQAEVKAGKTHRRGGAHIDGNWREKTDGEFDPTELVVLASDVEGCVAYLGKYKSELVGDGGDCSKVPLDRLKQERLVASRAYIGTVATIHESLPIKHACKRTLVRINVPL